MISSISDVVIHWLISWLWTGWPIQRNVVTRSWIFVESMTSIWNMVWKVYMWVFDDQINVILEPINNVLVDLIKNDKHDLGSEDFITTYKDAAVQAVVLLELAIHIKQSFTDIFKNSSLVFKHICTIEVPINQIINDTHGFSKFWFLNCDFIFDNKYMGTLCLMWGGTNWSGEIRE